MRPHSRLLLLVILIEGYVVLASELLAIRLLVPFVGSGVETVSIIISGVLLPLAVGYHVGGQRYHQLRAKNRGKPLAARWRQDASAVSVRRLLLKNIIGAIIILVLGLSFLFLEVFFSLLASLGITHILVQTAIYTLLFLVKPVFLLGQTVPLVSHYFARETLSKITGKMLFFSTLGSFLGSMVSTIILMSTIGVHLTAVMTIGLLCLLVILLSRRWLAFENILAVSAFALMLYLNHPATTGQFQIIADNAYNTAQVKAVGSRRDLMLNRSLSSRYAPNPADRFDYVQYIDKHIFASMPDGKRALILGAGAFTMGLENHKNEIVFVDIDNDLREIAESHILPEKLTDNKRFIAQSARAYLRQNKQPFDVIIVDVFSNQNSIPAEAVTVEFWQAIRQNLTADGMVVVNCIQSPTFMSRFAARFAQTFSAVFPAHLREAVTPFSIWDREPVAVNMLYIAKMGAHLDERGVYYDELNTNSIDKHR